MLPFNPQPKNKNSLVEINCKTCGKPFEVRNCDLRKGRKYCTKECVYKAVKPPMPKRAVEKTLKCDHCNKEYQTTLGRYNYVTKNFKHKYCSDECAKTAKRNRHIVTCKQCGKEYEERVSRIKSGSKFCTMSCYREWNKDNPRFDVMKKIDNTGSKNGQYKHGKYVGRGRSGGSSLKKKLREEVINVDGGNWCLLCGKPGPGLHLHRVIYGSQNGKYEIGNCVQLCVEDHQLVHTSKKTWQPVLKEYLADRTPFMRTVLLRFKKTINGG